jgi:hypothetical protein
MTMDASHRGALMLVRFSAACLMGMSLIELTLSWAEYHFRQQPISIPSAVLWGILFVAGVIILIKAKSVADWLSDKLE